MTTTTTNTVMTAEQLMQAMNSLVTAINNNKTFAIISKESLKALGSVTVQQVVDMYLAQINSESVEPVKVSNPTAKVEEPVENVTEPTEDIYSKYGAPEGFPFIQECIDQDITFDEWKALQQIEEPVEEKDELPTNLLSRWKVILNTHPYVDVCNETERDLINLLVQDASTKQQLEELPEVIAYHESLERYVGIANMISSLNKALRNVQPVEIIGEDVVIDEGLFAEIQQNHEKAVKDMEDTQNQYSESKREARQAELVAWGESVMDLPQPTLITGKGCFDFTEDEINEFKNAKTQEENEPSNETETDEELLQENYESTVEEFDFDTYLV